MEYRRGAAILEPKLYASGRLNMADETNEATVHITVRPNGPLRVEGHIVLKDADGNQWDLTGKPAISLCRCGLSEKRPFCDGAHGRNGWQCDTKPVQGNLT
jgi:CDGSH-type Zn-finger protein